MRIKNTPEKLFAALVIIWAVYTVFSMLSWTADKLIECQVGFELYEQNHEQK